MILLDGCIRTLRLFLPKDQRDDIIRELSEEIEWQAAEKEAELGRPLNIEEEAAVIAPYGHPLLTAARYRPQRHLVGPVVFPYYWLLLTVVVGLVIAGHVIGGGVLLAGGAGWAEMGRLAEQLIGNVLKVLGWITLLAVVADVWLTRSGVLERWNPGTLIPQQGTRSRHHEERPVQQATRAGREHEPLLWPRRVIRSSAAPSVSGFVVGVVLGVWWLLALKFPYLMFAGGADIVAWALFRADLRPSVGCLEQHS